MQIKLPYELSNDITATLSLKLSVGTEMRLQAAKKGYGPDELDNLIAQKLQEVAIDVASSLGIEYDAEPE